MMFGRGDGEEVYCRYGDGEQARGLSSVRGDVLEGGVRKKSRTIYDRISLVQFAKG